MIPEKAGLYVHFPFCERLCPYCDFTVYVRNQIPGESYTDALIADFEQRCPANFRFDTIYIGGGTPSLWAPHEFERFVSKIPTVDVREFTVEANPNDVTAERLSHFRACGVSRLSIGVQSFNDRVLESLGRAHDGATAREAVETAMAAGLEVSIDLMYGGPHYTEETARQDLEAVKSINPNHVSVYELTIEKGTVFDRLASSGKLNDASGDDRYRFGRILSGELTAASYERYEVSSYARPGKRAIHNSRYWLGESYLGVGVGSHSFLKTEMKREVMGRALKPYIQGNQAVDTETISPVEHWFERCMTSVRTVFPLNLNSLATELNQPDLVEPTNRALLTTVDVGWMIHDKGHFRTTERGLDFSDEIAARVLANLPDFA